MMYGEHIICMHLKSNKKKREFPFNMRAFCVLCMSLSHSHCFALSVALWLLLLLLFTVYTSKTQSQRTALRLDTTTMTTTSTTTTTTMAVNQSNKTENFGRINMGLMTTMYGDQYRKHTYLVVANIERDRNTTEQKSTPSLATSHAIQCS